MEGHTAGVDTVTGASGNTNRPTCVVRALAAAATAAIDLICSIAIDGCSRTEDVIPVDSGCVSQQVRVCAEIVVQRIDVRQLDRVVQAFVN